MEEKDGKKYESLFVEHVRAVLSLSTGSLVFSATLMGAFAAGSEAGKLEVIEYLIASWGLFVISIAFATLYSYLFALSARDGFKPYRRTLRVGSLVAHLSFFLGIVSFFIFACRNLAPLS